MISGILQTISNFGDLAVLLPLSAVLACVLWRCESHRAGVCFAAAILAGLVSIFLLKLILLSGELRVGTLALTSPSGHTCMSVLVYGALGVICLKHIRFERARPMALGLALLVTAIAATRIYLHYHSRSEVLVGLLAGAGCLAGFAWFYRRQQALRRIDGRILAGASCLAIALTLQHRLPAELWVRRLAAVVQCDAAPTDPVGACAGAVTLSTLPARLAGRMERLLPGRAI